MTSGARNFRRRVLYEARKWIGTPYLHQASVCGRGCDCLGLIRGVWRSVLGNEPEQAPSYSSDWAESGDHEPMLEAASRWFTKLDRKEACAGDLVLFRWHRSSVVKHAGILSGHNCFIHAYERAGVVETHLGSHWQKRIVAAFRFPDSEK